MALTVEQLLGGAEAVHEVELPAEFLPDDAAAGPEGEGAGPDSRVVRLRALTVRDLQKIAQAAGDDDGLAAALTIQHALVEPSLRFEQVQALPAGLAQHLVERIHGLSGISWSRSELEELVSEPMARAAYVLAREFGWSLDEVSELTMGQVLMYVQMIADDRLPG